MKKLLDYIRFAVFVAGVLIGVQIPDFVDQYGNSLNARVSESANSVSEFQDDADKYFNGDMNKLVEHYDNKSDPVIISGGESIGALVSRNQFLVAAQKRFSQSAYAAYLHVFVSPVEEIRNDVWNNHTYKVVLNVSAIFIGILFGFITSGLFELAILLLGLAIQVFNRKPKTDVKKARSI